MEVATSAVELEGGWEGGSEEEIKYVDGVFVCVNGSIGVSGKGICKSYHFWLVKSKLQSYLEEGLLVLADEECESIFKLKLTKNINTRTWEKLWKLERLRTWGEVEGAWMLDHLRRDGGNLSTWVAWENFRELDHLRNLRVWTLEKS